jgi:hypothetical protein
MKGSILLPFITALLAFTTQRDNPRPYVVVSNPHIVEAETPEYEELAYELTNNTAKAVTGWGIRYELRFDDGTTRSGGFGVLGPLREGDPPNHRPIDAHSAQRQTHLLGPRGRYPARDVTMTLQWAIFADRSFIGDATGVKEAFESRERGYRQHSFVANALRAARDEGTGLDALRAALRRVNEAPEEMKSWLVHVRGNIQRALDGKVPLDSDEYLASLIRSAEAERDRLDAHRRPRQSRAQESRLFRNKLNGRSHTTVGFTAHHGNLPAPPR